MTITLVRPPLRTSLSMTSGHDVPEVATVDGPNRPFGYLFSTWAPDTTEAEQDAGFYDEDEQVWVTPGGVITAGVYTKTNTGGSSGCSGDCVTDDACS